MTKDIQVSNANGMVFALTFTDHTDKRINSMMYDITERLDDMKYEGIIVPSEYCTVRKMFAKNPYFYDSMTHTYGFCVLPNTYKIDKVKDLITTCKRIHHVDQTIYMAYNYFDTFWTPYSHQIRGFSDVLKTTKNTFIDKKIMTFVL